MEHNVDVVPALYDIGAMIFLLGAALLEGLCGGRSDALRVAGLVHALAFLVEMEPPVGVEVAVGVHRP